MPRILRAATMLVALTLILTACADNAAQATAPQPTAPPAPPAAPTAAPTVAPTIAPTASPAPTAAPVLAKDVLVAGVAVGGLAPAGARQKLEETVQPLLNPHGRHAGG